FVVVHAPDGIFHWRLAHDGQEVGAGEGGRGDEDGQVGRGRPHLLRNPAGDAFPVRDVADVARVFGRRPGAEALVLLVRAADIGVGLDHDVEAGDFGAACETLGDVDAHVGPGGLRFGVGPDRVDDEVGGEPCACGVAVEDEVGAAGAGAEGDHDM